MKHFGDITKISGYDVPVVDIITGGSPCQDLSVAGKRAGLAGERSGLFMEQIRIVKEMRERDARDTGRTGFLVRPRYMVWENVPGAFSSNGGKDFQAVLEEIVGVVEEDVPDLSTVVQGGWTKSGCLYDELGKWSVAWRVHDAQFWGVPQRRKRIALVADFGGLSAPEILFERNGLSRDSEPGGAQGQGTAAGTEGGAGGTVYGIDHVITTGGNCTAQGPCYYEEVEATLKAAGPHAVAYGVVGKQTAISFQERAEKPGGGKGILIQRDHVGALSTLNNQSVLDNRCWSLDEKMGQTYVHDDMGNTLGARDYKQPQAVFAPVHDHAEPILLESNQNHATIQTDGISTALPAAMGMGGGYVPMVAHALSARYDGSPQPEKGNGSNIVAYAMQAIGEYKESDSASSCKMRDYKDATDLCRQGSTVRRLTPLECERLQGYPSVKKVDISKMTKDEYIAWNLAEGNILVDASKGKVYGTRGPGGCPYKEPKELGGAEVNGYRVVSIRNGATKLQCKVHRVVWISQHGVIPEGYVIDHINNDKQDNRITNLQLVTPAENSKKAREDGLYKTGLDNKATKLDPDLKDEIAYLYEYSDMTMRELAEIYGVSKSRIGQIVKEVGWTDIGEWTDSKGKKHKEADSPRYKALGNSIALPFWAWMARRICAQYERTPTMASLFDGIGGFPLVFSRAGAVPVWASEIEEFPIAVTKLRFPEVDA